MRQQFQESSKGVAIRRPAGWRLKAIWLGVAALVLQTLIPFAQGLPVSGDASFEQSLLFHCKLMRAGTDPAAPLPASGQDEGCVVCIAAAIGHCLIAPLIVSGLFPDTPATIILQGQGTDSAAGRSPVPMVARSPPTAA